MFITLKVLKAKERSGGDAILSTMLRLLEKEKGKSMYHLTHLEMKIKRREKYLTTLDIKVKRY